MENGNDFLQVEKRNGVAKFDCMAPTNVELVTTTRIHTTIPAHTPVDNVDESGRIYILCPSMGVVLCG